MALTMEQLKKLLDGDNYNYLIDPKRPALMLGARGINGSYQCYILLELEGKFLQFRLVNYANCPVGHPHLLQLLQVLGELNYQKRLIKFGWDSKDGEITAYADIWLEEDGTLTQTQFNTNIRNYFSSLDEAYRRIRQTIDTGKDPGEIDPAKMVEDAIAEGGSAVSPELRELLKKLRGESGEGAKADEDMSEI